MKSKLVLAALFLSGLSASALELGAPFADNAVLQRELPVPVWGWSKPGTEVTVEFAGQKHSAKAGENGKWMLNLDALTASAEPREMTITEKGGEARTLKNLLVGEVWMASGQSNMQWLASKSLVSLLVSQLKEKGETPPIREFEITSVYAALHPVERATGAWKVDDYGNYSAVAFAFALKVYQETGVPIGILNCSFSQTSIESWVPREGFAAGTQEYTKSIQQKILETDPTTPEHKKAWDAFYLSLEAQIKANAELVAAGKPALPVSTNPPGNMNDNRDASWMFNGRMSPVVPYAIRGAIWNQGYANIGGGIKYYQNLHSLIGGWRMKWNNPTLPVYFHQFYCPGPPAGGYAVNYPSIAEMAEMRLGAWMARDIPNTAMASQIDIAGAIHYSQKALPAVRLAYHALKNQYGKKDIVTDGPMFKSYSVQGNQLTVEFDHADGGFVVAETLLKPSNSPDGFPTPTIIPDGESKVTHFWIAGEDRVWHPATFKIDGSKVIVSSPAVKSPRGVSYGTGGIGFQPNLYNKSLLPTTPFIYFDNKPVTSETWPDKPMKIAGFVVDPNTVGSVQDYRRLPILRTQFRDNAILQADMPITISGSAVLEYGTELVGEKIIKFSFAGVEKTIPVGPEMREWSVTVPPMPASKEPKTLQVTMTINGELVHDRICKNILIGDVWYIASPIFGKKSPPLKMEESGQPVRVMLRMAKRSSADKPARYMVSTSTEPNNRFASTWEDATTDFASVIGHRLAKQSGRPTGIIHMTSDAVPLNSWMKLEHLKNAPSLMNDYNNLAQMQPGDPLYDANVRRYIAAWKTYWGEFIPQMIATLGVPNGEKWGTMPQLAGEVTSKACETHNVVAYSFVPASFKGIIFLTGSEMIKADQGENFGPELTALANGYIGDFGGKAKFIYTLPSKELAPKITEPSKITGESLAVPISTWQETGVTQELLDQVVKAATE
ncbi:MAG: sialate O-acetylesterase [Verrucomicrobiota bacterium]